MGRKKLVVGVVYRPPDLGIEASSSLMQELTRASKYNNVCIMGDFNYRNIDWESMTGDGNSEEFLNAIQDSFFKQIVREPTRQGNILDLVFTNNEALINQVEIGDKFDASDHHEIRFKINARREVEQNTAMVPDFRRANYQGLRYHLREVDWEEVGLDRVEGQERNEADIHYNSLVKQILTAQENYIPKKRIRSRRNDPKWMNSSIRKDIGKKRGLYRRIKRGRKKC